MKKLLLILAAIGLSATASATIVFSPGVSYISTELEQSVGSFKASTLLLDAKLGYVFPMGFYVGGMYHIESNSGSGLSLDEKAFSFGPSVGYYSPMGFYTLLTYYLVGERSDVSSSGDKFSEASGPQVDLGWVFPLTSTFSMGPQITYRSVNYSKYEDAAGVTTDVDRTQSVILPYISLWFMF